VKQYHAEKLTDSGKRSSPQAHATRKTTVCKPNLYRA